jgi:serine/threonine-protein kinase RsbW
LKINQQTLFRVKSDLKSLEEVLFHLGKIYQSWIPKKDWSQCQLALVEGFTNAVRHAHKMISSEVLIEIQLTLTEENLEIRIWDYGPPFNLDTFIQNLREKEGDESEGGRGIQILQKISNHLSYIRTYDNRNCLLIVKQFSLLTENANG